MMVRLSCVASRYWGLCVLQHSAMTSSGVMSAVSGMRCLRALRTDGTCVSAVSRGVYCRHVSCRRFCCALVHFARNCSACSLRSSPWW